MNKLPATEFAALVRTDFSSKERWTELQRVAANPPEPFIFSIVAIDDIAFETRTVAELVASLPEDYPHSSLFVADQRALGEDGLPCLVVDLLEEPGRTFRTLAREMASIENNLSIANMGFEEFEAAAGPNGVFAGFE